MRALTVVLLLSVLAAALPAGGTMDVYAIDTEGGKAMLTISPSGETMLVDLGWTDSGMRASSTAHLIEALQAIGVKRIDHLAGVYCGTGCHL